MRDELTVWCAGWVIVARVRERAAPAGEAALVEELIERAEADARWSGAIKLAGADEGALVRLRQRVGDVARAERSTWEGVGPESEPCGGRSITIPADSLRGGELAVCELDLGHEGPHADEEREAHWTDADVAVSPADDAPPAPQEVYFLRTESDGFELVDSLQDGLRFFDSAVAYAQECADESGEWPLPDAIAELYCAVPICTARTVPADSDTWELAVWRAPAPERGGE